MKYLKKLNTFLSDNDRGIGHGLSQGMFYAFLFLPFTIFGPTFILTLLALNHLRVTYKELVYEDWKSRKKTGDFWFDCFFRPLQTSVLVLGFGFLSSGLWAFVVFAAVVLGVKKKNEWPFLIFWKG